MKPKKAKCRWCDSSRPVIKWYVIADDMENPKPYHPACIRKLHDEVLMKLADNNDK